MGRVATHRALTWGLAILTCVVLLASPVPRAIASYAPEDVWQSVSVVVSGFDGNREPTVIVSAALREGIELPAEVALAIPAGSLITWAGELTGDPQQDPEVEITAREQRDGYEVARFTLRYTPYAQIEMSAPEGLVTPTAAGRRIALAWVSAGSAERARVGVLSPLSAHLQGTVPEATVEVRPEGIAYTVERTPVEAGDRLTFSGELVAGQAPELAAMTGGGDEQSASATDTTAAPVGESPPIDDAAPDRTGSILILVAGVLFVAGAVLFAKARESRKSHDA